MSLSDVFSGLSTSPTTTSAVRPILGVTGMTFSELAAIASVISGIAVLGPLTYFAQQTRQN
jgi:hypothetical protein